MRTGSKLCARPRPSALAAPRAQARRWWWMRRRRGRRLCLWRRARRRRRSKHTRSRWCRGWPRRPLRPRPGRPPTSRRISRRRARRSSRRRARARARRGRGRRRVVRRAGGGRGGPLGAHSAARSSSTRRCAPRHQEPLDAAAAARFDGYVRGALQTRNRTCPRLSINSRALLLLFWILVQRCAGACLCYRRTMRGSCVRSISSIRVTLLSSVIPLGTAGIVGPLFYRTTALRHGAASLTRVTKPLCGRELTALELGGVGLGHASALQQVPGNRHRWVRLPS